MGLEEGGRFDPDKVTYGGFSEAGARMDQRLLEYCIDKADKAGGGMADWFGKQTLLVRRRVRRSVEAAKIKLSREESATVEFAGAQVSEVVIKAVGKLDNVNFVVLSGGSSLSSVVQESVLSIFRHIPEERFFLPDPTKPEDVETAYVRSQRVWLGCEGMGFPQSISGTRRSTILSSVFRMAGGRRFGLSVR